MIAGVPAIRTFQEHGGSIDLPSRGVDAVPRWWSAAGVTCPGVTQTSYLIMGRLLFIHKT